MQPAPGTGSGGVRDVTGGRFGLDWGNKNSSSDASVAICVVALDG